MSKRQRRRYSPEEKAKILRLHLLEQVPISEICEKQGIHPTMFYQWQKALFENAAAALEGQRGTRSTNRQRQAPEAMESKLKRKDEVLAIAAIILKPDRFREFEPGVRTCRVPKFPYSILYTFREHDIMILAVKHDRRDPDI